MGLLRTMWGARSPGNVFARGLANANTGRLQNDCRSDSIGAAGDRRQPVPGFVAGNGAAGESNRGFESAKGQATMSQTRSLPRREFLGHLSDFGKAGVLGLVASQLPALDANADFSASPFAQHPNGEKALRRVGADGKIGHSLCAHRSSGSGGSDRERHQQRS